MVPHANGIHRWLDLPSGTQRVFRRALISGYRKCWCLVFFRKPNLSPDVGTIRVASARSSSAFASM